MAEPTPFEVLAVSLDVDDAALKKAYFRKIRENPPETRPTEYQRVHEAFELLRDPERRRAIAERLLDGGLPPELEALLNQVDAAMRENNVHGAVELLRAAVQQFPSFEPARVMLARQLTGLQRSAEALQHAKALCELKPDSVPAQLLVAEIQMDSYEYAAAREAIARAKELDPNDRRPLVIEAMMYRQMEKYDDALVALEKALILTDRRYVPDAQLIGHRVVMQTDRGHATAMKFEVERIVVGAGQGQEERAAAASLLVQLAGVVLGKARPQLAREILAQAQALAPERKAIDVGAPREEKLEHLAAATQQAVAKTRAERPAHLVVRESRRTAAMTLFVGSILLVAVSTVIAMNVGGNILTTATLFLGIGGIVSGRKMLARAKSGGGAGALDYYEVRPFHFIEVFGGTVRIIPLLSLTGIVHKEGGAELRFEAGVPPIELDGSSELYGLLDSVLAQRERLLSLLTSDLIETEQQLEPLDWS